MDEHELTTGLMEIIDQTAYRNAVKRVRKVHVELGGCLAVDQERLKLDFEHATRNTVAEGAELDIQVLPVRRHCQSCGDTFDAGSHDLPCPHCGHPHTFAVTGEEARVVDMEVELVEA